LSDLSSSARCVFVHPSKPDVVRSVPLRSELGALRQLSTLRAASERRQKELPDLLFLIRWSGELAKTSHEPAGDLINFRKWIEGRITLKKAYEKEERELVKSSHPFDEAQLRTSNYDISSGEPTKSESCLLENTASRERKPVPVIDVPLREALRILADMSQLDHAASGQPQS